MAANHFFYRSKLGEAQAEKSLPVPSLQRLALYSCPRTTLVEQKRLRNEIWGVPDELCMKPPGQHGADQKDQLQGLPWAKDQRDTCSHTRTHHCCQIPNTDRVFIQ